MRVRSTVLTLFGALALALLAVAPGTAQARPATGNAVVTITATSSSYEYYETCSNTPPYPCNKLSAIMGFNVFVTNTPHNGAITVNYQIVAGTATAGVDYTGSTGTISVAPGYPGAVQIPIVDDGVAENAETLSVHFTGASVPADLSAVGNGTILDGGSFPADCSFSRNATSGSFTCTGRPANQRWQATLTCIDPDIEYPRNIDHEYGNVVTGNGTSSASCRTGANYQISYLGWLTV